MEVSKPLVVVLSRNYSTGLGMIRALGAAGYTVDLIASVKKNGSSIIASSSKYVRKSIEVLSTKIQGDDGENIIDVLEKYAAETDEKIFLLPVDDFTTTVVDNNRELLQKSFYMPYVVDGTISNCMDKSIQNKIAKTIGLSVPDEWIVSLRDEICIPDEVKYPCFVKPLKSKDGHKTEMKKCLNDKELQEHLVKMKNFYRDRDVLIQEFLEIEKEYDLSGISIDQKVIIPAVIEKTEIAKHEVGVTMCGKLLDLTELKDTIDKIQEFVKQFHYVGMFDMEFNYVNGKLYFNEMNFRSGGPNYSYFLAGVNLPDILIKNIMDIGYNPTDEDAKKTGFSIIYEKVAWEDYINGYISKSRLQNLLNNADYKLLENEEDSKPGKIFNRRIRLSALKHKLKYRGKK